MKTRFPAENRRSGTVRTRSQVSMLNERSEVLARKVIKKCLEIGIDVEALRKAGKNGARIAVLLPRTRDYMTALIAVIRAGCALIPLDSEYPKNRINNIISDSQCILCITTKGLAAKTDDVPKLLIEDIVFGEENELTDLDLSDPEIEGFFLYTSGSTGKPKGVVHHQSVFSSFNDILIGSCLPDENDICCCMTMFTFIVSINDLCVPIIVGGSLYIADEKERVNVDALYDVIKKRGITSMFLPPQMFTVMRELHGVLPLKYVILAGEKLRTQCPDDGNVYEIYGSSEASPIVKHKVGYDDPRLLGKSGRSSKHYLFDENGNVINSPGMIGELCVVSPFLALRYNNMPEETAAKFVDCPFESGKRNHPPKRTTIYD